jgi:hypothetical protein
LGKVLANVLLSAKPILDLGQRANGPRNSPEKGRSIGTQENNKVKLAEPVFKSRLESALRVRKPEIRKNRKRY